MVRNFITTLLACYLGMHNGVTKAQQVTIQVNGQVTGSTCNVRLEGSTNPLVILPRVTASQLNSTGKTAGEKTITLEMMNCSLSGAQTVTPSFSPNGNLSTSGGRLKNTAASGAAVNVELELLHQGQSLNLAAAPGQQGAGSIVIPAANGSGSMQYAVRYYATGQAAPGIVHSSMTWQVDYN